MTDDIATATNENSTPVTLRKSLWQLIISRISAFREDIGRTFESGHGVDSVTFSISFIALAAKLAKADGQVTRDEVSMFREIFTIPPQEKANAARVYNLCRQEVSGYHSYARKLSNALGSGEIADGLRHDVLDGLFHIAMADGEFHPGEEQFLLDVAEVFEIPDEQFDILVARHVPGRENPFDILGLPADASTEDARRAWRQLVKDNHPDVLASHGLPEEMRSLAESRMISINKAYEDVTNLFQARVLQTDDDIPSP
ncbi:hypothetical protein LCGC14_0043760 [marine sediment metagenome]|uniref:DnaJ family molecular chaperone n=2 Tax=root TaxID=1 RepID=A0A7V1FP14_9RHOB|nr:DnaJ family molecular chaperone [Sulfitobacter litoralis]HDZ53431.1 DnaJ family molecular chaperone [Sulfitobacter litoralis]